MRISTPFGYALGAAALVTLAACSGGSSAIAPLAAANGATGPSASSHLIGSQSATALAAASRLPSRQTASWMNQPDAHAAPGLVYISDTLANNVTVFDTAGKMQGQIGGFNFPGGIFVDGKHNLWVANNVANNVLEFARGATTPSKTLSDPGAGPNDVTICPNGAIYVLGSDSTTIEVYAKGHLKPTRGITFAGSQQNDFLTCDKKGNVFVTMVVSFHGGVVEFPGGKQQGAVQLPISMGGPGGIKPDDAGNLLVDDQSAQTVTEYTEAGAPTGLSIKTAFDCIGIGVMRDSKVVGCAVYAASGTSEGQSYNFPGGAARQTYSGSFMLPYGFAFDPGQKGI
jgi:hypothetical protein